MPHGNITTADEDCLADALATDALWHATREDVKKIERGRPEGDSWGVWILTPWNGNFRVNGIPADELYTSQRKAMERCAKLRADWAAEMTKAAQIKYEQDQAAEEAERKRREAAAALTRANIAAHRQAKPTAPSEA